MFPKIVSSNVCVCEAGCLSLYQPESESESLEREKWREVERDGGGGGGGVERKKKAGKLIE